MNSAEENTERSAVVITQRGPSERLTAKAVLKRNYLFRGLPDATLDRLAALAGRRAYQKGGVIFSQGDPGDALFGVASGRVRISASGSGGREVFLNIMEPGDTFGEIAVMDGLPRTAGATALDDTTLVVLKRVDFLALLEREPRLGIHLLMLLCQRLRWTSELVEESAFLSGTARLAKRLLILASLHGRPAAAGTGSMELRISQADLAHFLGVSRQVVNQQLGEWAKAGWVELGRSRIVIRRPEELRKIATQAAAVPA
ncbi:MAG TPA: Crp/Fnr family transcriptional regulator [Gammaproteobacteria bacterium]|nr:Crp/Fnr family transcriptional regulator [Gammaproteobacteria bacterium]